MWRMKYYLSIMVMLIGVVAMVIGAVFIYQGYEKEGWMKEAMWEEQVTLGLTEEQIQRIKRLGVIPSMQPNFVGEWGWPGGMYDQRLGSERIKMNNPYRRLLDEGIRIAFGSDCGFCPPWPMNPIFGLWGAIRHPIKGSDITLEEAVRAYTLDAAYSSFEEGIKGSLEPGKLADIIVLSRDISAIDADEIKDVTVDLTMVGGKLEYRAPV